MFLHGSLDVRWNTPSARSIVQRMRYLERLDVASEDILVQLLKLKCMPILLHAVEVNLSIADRRDLQSLDFTVNRFCMKFLRTSDISLIKYYQEMSDFEHHAAGTYHIAIGAHSTPICVR